jgi:hypothetical protein
MDEETLDRAFRERHGLDTVLKEGTYSSKHLSGRRVEFKRVILARLEGYSALGKEFADWYMVESKDGGDPVNVLNQRLSHQTTPMTKARIKEVRSRVARETTTLVLTGELRKIEEKIQDVFRRYKLPPLTPGDILNADRLPIHKYISSGKFFDVERALKMYLLMLQGTSTEGAAMQAGFKGGRSIATKVLSLYYSDAAKNALRNVKGWNPNNRQSE